jgi:hypothetical protein
VVERGGPDLRVYLVWVPILFGDGPESADSSSRPYRDPRVRQFFDDKGALADLMGKKLDLPKLRHGGRAWDVYLLYPPGARWTPDAPAPAFWMHQLEGVDPKRAPKLDTKVMLERIGTLTSSRSTEP